MKTKGSGLRELPRETGWMAGARSWVKDGNGYMETSGGDELRSERDSGVRELGKLGNDGK